MQNFHFSSSSFQQRCCFFASFPFDCAIKTRANFVTAAKEQCHVVRMSLFKNWHLGFSATAHDIDAQPSRQSILRSFRAQTRVAMVTIEMRWRLASSGSAHYGDKYLAGGPELRPFLGCLSPWQPSFSLRTVT